MKRGKCDACKKDDLLGFVACLDLHLCPECSGAFLDADPASIRADLEARVKTQVEKVKRILGESP